MNIDLHIHTTYSDGHQSPTEIVQSAKNGGLDCIAITDHDGLSGIPEAIAEGKREGIAIIPGVEISTYYQNQVTHILGYRVDLSHLALVGLLKTIRDHRWNAVVKRINDLNLTLAPAHRIDPLVFQQRFGEYYGKPNIALYLVERGITQTISEAFKILGRMNMVPRTIVFSHAIDAIHAAGGIAVLAHPLAPKLSLKEMTDDHEHWRAIIKEMIHQGLDGIECFHSGHTREDTNWLVSIVQQCSLVVTGGSDWHGTLRKVNEDIREYIPFYCEALGQFSLPEPHASNFLRLCPINLNSAQA